jgi:hypothetical protein
MTTRTQLQPEETRLLRRELQTDGILSALAGAVLAVASNSVSDFLGLNAPAFILGLGIVLFVYGLAVFAAATRFVSLLNLTRTVILLNVIWVIASVVLLVGGWLPLTMSGQWAIGIVAAVVAVLGIIEFIGMRSEVWW